MEQLLATIFIISNVRVLLTCLYLNLHLYSFFHSEYLFGVPVRYICLHNKW